MSCTSPAAKPTLLLRLYLITRQHKVNLTISILLRIETTHVVLDPPAGRPRISPPSRGGRGPRRGRALRRERRARRDAPKKMVFSCGALSFVDSPQATRLANVENAFVEVVSRNVISRRISLFCRSEIGDHPSPISSSSPSSRRGGTRFLSACCGESATRRTDGGRGRRERITALIKLPGADWFQWLQSAHGE